MSRRSRKLSRDMQHMHLWKLIDDYSGFELLANQIAIDYKGSVVKMGDMDPPDSLAGEFELLPPTRLIPFSNQLAEKFIDNDPPA